MKFKHLLNEEMNTPTHQQIVDAIHNNVEAELLDWGVQYTTDEFVQILGITKGTLAEFITNHRWNVDHITISFSGNQDEYLDLGPDPAGQMFGHEAQSFRIFTTDVFGGDEGEMTMDMEPLEESTTVGKLNPKQKDKLWKKYIEALKKAKKKFDEKKLKKEFDKKSLIDIGKEIQKLTK